MKKKFRKMTAVLLSFLMSVMMFGSTTVNAASTTNEPVGVSQSDAVAWLNAQDGASYDFGNFYDEDGNYWYGTQCPEFVRAYVNWVVNGNPWTDAWNRPTLDGGSIWKNSLWSELGWTVYTNTAEFVPQPGDIFSSGIYNVGHTGVVISSDVNTAVIADSNARNGNPYDGDSVWVHPITWRSANSDSAYGATHFIRPNFTSNVPYVRPAITRTYINYQQSGAYRVNVEVTNVESISSVQVATWTQQDQSDLHWNSCAFNGGATYFVDLSRADFASNQTSYCNDVYVYDTRGECVGYERIGTIYNTPAIVKTYINYQQANSYRVNIEVTNIESISSVRVATWTQQNQSDLHWNTCSFNGGATYFIDLSRSDFANNQAEYCNDVYVYDGTGNCVDYARTGTIYAKPYIEDIKVTKVSEAGYRVVCRMNSQFGIASAQLPTWTENKGQDDLVWHSGSVSGNYISCYIKAAEHNNELSNYITHLYVTDNIGQYVGFSGVLPYINLTNECNQIDSFRYMKNKYILYNRDFTWKEAKDWCESQGGHLATFQDEQEWDVIKDLLNEHCGIPVWLGAENTSGTWKWVTGENISFSDWEEYQPDNYNGIEHYLGTHNYDYYLDCYKWNDYQNDSARIGGFICEFDDYYIVGDTNLDGKITISDVTAIQRHLAELELFTDEQIALADTNGDGVINIIDATHLQKYLAEFDGIVLGKQTA